MPAAVLWNPRPPGGVREACDAVGLLTGGCVAVAAFATVNFSVGANDPRPLPLRSPPTATPRLTAIVSDQRRSRLERIDPATFAPLRASARLRWYEGWVRSPDGKLLAVSANPEISYLSYSTLHLASASTLRWQPGGIPLGGYFQAAIWPRPRTLYALALRCCGPGLTLDKIDLTARRIVSRTKIQGPLLDTARSASGLVLLARGRNNRIGPARLLVVDREGDVRSLRLARIFAGSHYNRSGHDPMGTVRQPGLTVDAAHGIAFVLDPDGLIAAVSLRDLRVTHHQLVSKSLLTRLSAWLTPTAQAKGANGPTLTAQWLGQGLIALTGDNQTASWRKHGGFAFSMRPAGLRIVDTHTWSVRRLDPQADTMLVADGVLLTSGGSTHSESGHYSTNSNEGLAAYNPNGSLRWRLDHGVQVTLLAAYVNRALIQKSTGSAPIQLLNLDTGHLVRRLPNYTSASLLLGSGSEGH
jgi:hypothetical protein